ncbi:MAG: hypothetical protein KDC54_01935, partial [Lewinella sp.]|nr:hypothetical protein [Lewinella sp.]
MWFTSYEGLNRFDGHDFKIYYAIPGDSTTLSGNLTLGLVEDPYGDIWVGTEHCLQRYRRQSDDFNRYYPTDEAGRRQTGIHIPFYADSTEVWFMNEPEGVVALNYHTGARRLITEAFRYRWNISIVNSIRRSADGKLWIRRGSGLVGLDPAGARPTSYFSSDADNELGPSTAFACHLPVADGSLWLGMRGGLIQFFPDERKWVHYPIDTNIVVADIQRETDGTLYLGTEDSGLYHFRPGEGILDHLTPRNSALTNPATATIYLDDQGIIWVNTDPEGIAMLLPTERGFRLYGDAFYTTQGLPPMGIRCFAEDERGLIWLGSQENGLFVLDPVSDRVVRHLSPHGPHGIPENHASCILHDSQGRIWVGTYNGLYRSDEGDTFHLVDNGIPMETHHVAHRVWDMVETPTGYLWIGTSQGVFYVPPGAERAYALDTLQTLSTGDLQVWGDWLLIPSYQQGAWMFNYRKWEDTAGKEREVHHFFREYNVKQFFPQGDSLLWMALTRGLLKTRLRAEPPALEVLAHYTKADGLPSENLYGILPDGEGAFWISSNRGIVRFDPAKETFDVFGLHDQLQGYEYNTNAYLISRTGDFYFGGVRGFNRFRPPIPRNLVPPDVQVTAMEVNGQPLLTETYLGELHELELSYQDNTFTLHFAAIDYLSRGSNCYRVRLWPFDEEWIDLGERSMIRYTRVPPGQYRFEVTAANNDGVWRTTPRTLSILIRRPWYGTLLAWSIYAGLA